jgi:hypothetical protein
MKRVCIVAGAALLLSACSPRLQEIFTPPTPAKYDPVAADQKRKKSSPNVISAGGTPPDGARLWEVRKGEKYSNVIRRIASDFGYEVKFKALDDCMLEADAMIPGTMIDAIEEVNGNLSEACPEYIADITHGNRQIVIFQDGAF